MLGPQAGVLHLGITTDPLERLVGGSTYAVGGAARYLTSLIAAIRIFIQRVYPKAGEEGLLVVPLLPGTTEDITWEEVTRHMVKERHGGILAGKRHLSLHVVTSILTRGSGYTEHRQHGACREESHRGDDEEVPRGGGGEESHTAAS